ncbi:unnamed protein product [Spirodela intermedia]|uniref:Uncharacterized protein n=2 Tax=Spirodela intermedia TaxID=51605 RepID=A0A7I8L1L6_SPIIN|nr:unnamed protein product [Spirodela intermedia]CAA6666404.1 unnamed protein product [Spirodela intermedia]CAA7403185.1 unnamed protein product [Spirodela intermedia]
MPSMMGSHGVALATAVAVSGTVVLLGFCRQKSPSPPQLDAVAGEDSLFPLSSLRSSISDATKRTSGRTMPATSTNKEDEETKKKKKQQQKKKRVHFAEQVVELHVQDEEGDARVEKMSEVSPLRYGGSEIGRGISRGMPANRTALYNGILRDRHYHMA